MDDNNYQETNTDEFTEESKDKKMPWDLDENKDCVISDGANNVDDDIDGEPSMQYDKFCRRCLLRLNILISLFYSILDGDILDFID